MKILFIHPDLGIGGAERLIIDMALVLQKLNHQVNIITANHDKNHCFKETIDGSLMVTVVGNFLPWKIFNRFHAIFSYLRMIFIAFCLYFCKDLKQYTDCDVIVCDQVSAHIPFLKLFSSTSNAKILFYCHFPDLLLSKKEGILKKIYRFPLDWIEEKTTGMADCILVNSHFTASIFRDTFKSLAEKDIHILYPICNFSSLDSPIKASLSHFKLPKSITTIFLSLNRFERKKHLELAIEAFSLLLEKLQGNPKLMSSCHLVIAGGYDTRLEENVSYFNELKDLIGQKHLEESVTLIKSPTDEEKNSLLHSSTAVIYTPQNEHFGIVPLESMYMGRPVIACNSGGPMETIEDGETGFLCESCPKAFADKLAQFVMDKSLSREMGASGRARVVNYFSEINFKKRLNQILDDLIS